MTPRVVLNLKPIRMGVEAALRKWERLRRALTGEPLPAAFVDLDAFDSNVTRTVDPVRAAGKTLRIASKSVRCPELLHRIVTLGGPAVRGLMTYTARETAFLAEQGFKDLLLAYPTVSRDDASELAKANAGGASAAVVADAAEQLEILATAAAAARTRIPVVIELDLGWRPLGSRMHLGVRRSPLRSTADVLAFAERVRSFRPLEYRGLMGYEAQIAGVQEDGPFWRALGIRLMKRFSKPSVAAARRKAVSALTSAGFASQIVNGGGTGSLAFSASDSSLTEVTAGSGFLAGHLFDGYRGLTLEPALLFALQAVRRPTPGIVTCHGGGFISSGEAGESRLPRPWLPEGLSLLRREGAGEVQTPLRIPRGTKIALGDPVCFRPAKSGELAEHFNEFLLIRGERIEGRAKTYRGLGRCFLG